MKTNHFDIVVIGSGPGGLAAAITAKKNGARSVLIIERDVELGGILLQCIHNGFGVEIFKEDLPGPTYAQRFINQIGELGIETMLDTMVLNLTAERCLTLTSKTHGYRQISAKAVVLAMGCRERTRAQVRLPGTRPAGVYTAGTAQRWVNVEGYMPGKKIVILGSGDIGMIMARRLTFEGAKVERVLEIMPYLSGLTRNYVQCLQDFDIPLKLQHTVKRIFGNDRIEAVETVAVDDTWQPIPGSEETIACDTLLLSVGLIPENELSLQAGVRLHPTTAGPVVDADFHTSVPGIFAAGNVVHVYDLVDWVTEAGYAAGKAAALYAADKLRPKEKMITTQPGENVRYIVPQHFDTSQLTSEKIPFQMRVSRPIEKPVWVEARIADERLTRRGLPYARPGEMITLDLKPEHFEKFNKNNSITIRIIER